MRISDWSSDVCSSDLAIADIGSEEILTDRLVIGDRRVTVELGGDRRLARVTVHRDNIWLDRFQRRQGCNGHNAGSRQRASNASDGPRQLFGALGRRKLVTFPACSLFKIGFQLVLWNTNCHRNTSAIRVDRAAQRGA